MGCRSCALSEQTSLPNLHPDRKLCRQKNKMGNAIGKQETPEALFDKINKSNDGAICVEDIRNHLIKQIDERVKAIFADKKFNPDKDGKITKEEFTKMMADKDNLAFFRRMVKIETPVMPEPTKEEKAKEPASRSTSQEAAAEKEKA